MRRHLNERGAALIMLIGMIAALAMLAGTLVFVIANESKATEITRSRTQSFYGGEAALDSAIQMTKVASPMPTAPTGTPWLTQTDLAAAFNSEFPTGSTVTYLVYDNVPNIDFGSLVLWDSNADRRMWVDATCAAPDGRKTRERVLIQQVTMPFAAALPKAVTYSDTGITLNDTSDIYAVNADGSAIADGSMPTYISAGGTWTTSMSSGYAEVGRFTLNSGANLSAPSSSAQSLGIKVNGSVKVGSTTYNSAPNHKIPNTSSPKFTNVFISPGTVGYLSDYFDQAAQASLANEAQEGGTPASAPTAPASWTSTGYTSITSTLLSTITGASYSNTTQDLYLPTSVSSGNMTISASSARTYHFRNLYVGGNLSIDGPITFSATSLHVGGTITITNTSSGTPTVTDSFGPLYVAGTGSSSVTGSVNVTTTSAYFGGALSIENSTNAAGLADNLGSIYCAGDLTVAPETQVTGGRHPTYATYPVTLNAPTYLYGGGDVTINGPSSGTTTNTFGLIYTSNTAKALTFSGNTIVKATGVTANGDFTISGATTAIKDWLGAVYVAAYSSSSNPSANHGDVNWSGTASVTSRNYVAYDADPSSADAQPKPMWLGRYFSRTGTYNDEYGNIWVPGNSTTSVVFGSTGASTVLCPLLCTTERNQWSGNVTYGSRTQPMVFFFMCDNNGIYPQVVDWKGTGTYYGLMVINESTIDFSGDTTPNTPTVEGAVFAGCPYDPTHTSGMSMSDIVLNDSCSVAYNQAVVGAIATSSLKTTTTVTQTVPGSWQQLPVN